MANQIQEALESIELQSRPLEDGSWLDCDEDDLNRAMDTIHGNCTEALTALRTGKLVVVDKQRIGTLNGKVCPRAVSTMKRYCMKYGVDWERKNENPGCTECISAYLQGGQ